MRKLRPELLFLFGLIAALSFCTCLKTARADGPANAPAPMFGLNISNTGQSSEAGPTTIPTIAWTDHLNPLNFTYAPKNLALSATGLLYAPGLYALNTSDGSIAWHASTGWRDSTVALDSSGLEFAPEGGRLIARSATTGTQAWAGVDTLASDLDPSKIGPDGTAYSTTFNGDMYAFTSSGQLKWVARAGTIQYGEASHIPAIDGSNNLYYGADTGLRSLNSAGQVRWSIDWAPLGASTVMLVPNGDVVWQRDGLVEERNPTTGALVSSFLKKGNALQATDSSGNLYFSNGGEILKTTSTGQAIWQYSRQSLDVPLTVDAVGNVYTGDEHGNVICLSYAGTELWELSLGSNYLGGYHLAPVLGANGDIYVMEAQQQTVIALTVPEPAAWMLAAVGASIIGLAIVGRTDRRCQWVT